jgi:hypothetical protein
MESIAVVIEDVDEIVCVIDEKQHISKLVASMQLGQKSSM